MNIFIDSPHSNLILISLIAIFIFIIKNKVLSIILKLSEKTNTVYDELVLFSIKTPSSYLIVIGYSFIILDYFIKNNVFNILFNLTSALFLLIIVTVSW